MVFPGRVPGGRLLRGDLRSPKKEDLEETRSWARADAYCGKRFTIW